MKSKYIALYFHTGNSLFLCIPKKNGRGYLKHPLGGHHQNKLTNDFLYGDDLRGIMQFKDTTDIDNYLSLKMCKVDYHDEYEANLAIVFAKIQETWSWIEGFEEMTRSEFFDFVMSSQREESK